MDIENLNTNLSIIVSVLAIVGAIWGLGVFARKRITKLENTIRADIQTMLRDEATLAVAPMVEAEVNQKLAALEQQIQAIDRKAEAGYRYVRYLQEGKALTQMRIAAKGAEWRDQAPGSRPCPTVAEKMLKRRPSSMPLSESANQSLQTRSSTKRRSSPTGDLGYQGLVDAYATVIGIRDQSWAIREHAFHERLTTSCIRGLQDKLYSFLGPVTGGSPEFYTQAISVCTISIISDIAALRRGDLIP